MARKIIVSLVSAQTIPNILFIKENWSADFYYFIDTEHTLIQGFTENIIQSLNLPKSQTKSIEVSESSITDIQGKLKSEIKYEDSDELFINVTGGTKIMSIAVYSFFAGKGDAKIYYLPIEKNQILQIFPQKTNYITEITQTINLQEYLTAYGVQIISQSTNTPIKPVDQTELLFYAFLEHNKRKELLAIANQIREKGLRRRGKKIKKESYKELFNELSVFNNVGLQFEKEAELSKDEIKYITGDWFEQYIYSQIKALLNKSDQEIGLGLHLAQKGKVSNEYDVMFVHKNQLHVIECKTDISDTPVDNKDQESNKENQNQAEEKIRNLFSETLHKAAALKKEFGLIVHYYVFALNDFSSLNENQKKRANYLEIKLVGLEILKDKHGFEQFIKNDLKPLK